MQTIHFKAAISGTHIDCISLISSHTLGSFSSWHAHLNIFWKLIPIPDLKTWEVNWCLRAIYCLPQILAVNSQIFFFLLHRAPIRYFHRKIDYNCVALFLRSNGGWESQLTFSFSLPTIITARLISNSLFRISLNYFQPFNKSPPLGFKMFHYLITPASKKYVLFLMTFIPKRSFFCWDGKGSFKKSAQWKASILCLSTKRACRAVCELPGYFLDVKLYIIKHLPQRWRKD